MIHGNVVEYIWQPADSRHFARGRAGVAPIGIVLHSTCGSLAGDIATLTTESREVSAHWYVTKTGEVYHFVQDCDTAYHAGEVIAPEWSNRYTLGIEQEHLDGEEPWPVLQVQTTARLCAALDFQHRTVFAIRHHAQIAAPPGRKSDPVDYPSDVFWPAYESAQGVWIFKAQ